MSTSKANRCLLKDRNDAIPAFRGGSLRRITVPIGRGDVLTLPSGSSYLRASIALRYICYGDKAFAPGRLRPILEEQQIDCRYFSERLGQTELQFREVIDFLSREWFLRKRGAGGRVFVTVNAEQVERLEAGTYVPTWKSGQEQQVSMEEERERRSERRSKRTTKRDHILAKTGGKCWYCGIALAECRLGMRKGEKRLHIEHVHPRSNGGSNHVDNLVPSCTSCNASKGTKSIDEFRKHVSAQKGSIFSTVQRAYWKTLGVSLPDDKFIKFHGEIHSDDDEIKVVAEHGTEGGTL